MSDNSDKGSNPYQELDERLLELTSLFEISRSLTSSLSIRSIMKIFCENPWAIC